MPFRADFPGPGDPEQVGVSGDLSVGALLAAYRHGIFPWPDGGRTIPWFSPDPRCLIPAGTVHESRSLRATTRREGWRTSVDEAFPAVMDGCAENRDTWISPAMRAAYVALHEAGHAHSVEVWSGADLVGGVYGVQVGAVFTGESMFHRVTGASKAALVALDRRFAAAGGRVLDAQLPTEHLVSLGFGIMARADFVHVLEVLRDVDVRL